MNENIQEKIIDIVGPDYFIRDNGAMACYGYDASACPYLPDAVVFPETTRDVSALVTLADANGFPIVARGSGTGTTGGCLAVQGGLVLVTTRMNRILDIDTDNLVAHVEPGVMTGALHTAVEAKGLYYPPDPSSANYSTLGGNLAECAGGPRAVKYGVTRDYVLGLEAVIGTGEIIRTGVQTVKGVVGYDLTRLLAPPQTRSCPHHDRRFFGYTPGGRNRVGDHPQRADSENHRVSRPGFHPVCFGSDRPSPVAESGRPSHH
jgi:glycolate dehydrogenase FAD-linked subunit